MTSQLTNNSTVSKPTANPVQSLPKPSVRGYIVGQLVGKGTYGYVFRATKINFSNDVVAVKCILLNSLSKSSQNNVITEISILKQLKHKFIVQMLDFQWDKNFIYMIFEFCPGGELATIIHLKRCFPEDIVQHFLQQLASAMQYFRSCNVSHMDLKPQNILISGIPFVNLLNELNTVTVWRNVVLKIADLGFAQHLSDEERATSFRGSPLYMAPEIMTGREYDARVDLWSIGVILYQCLFGHTPYQCTGTDDLIQKFKRGQIEITIPSRKPKISNKCRDLLKRLLEFDPKRRISFDGFFSHPFLDLEHMPCPESNQKVKSIITEAVKEDNKANYLTAFYLYRDAIEYMMPLSKWGDLSGPFNPAYQESLKRRMVQYMERAEWLQKQCNFKNIDSEVMSQIQDIYNTIDSARELCEQELYQQSIDQYDSAIEKALVIMNTSGGTLRREFFGEINDWMSEYEAAKQKKSAMPPKEDARKDFKSLSLKHQRKANDQESEVSKSVEVAPVNSEPPSGKRTTSLSTDHTVPPVNQPKRKHFIYGSKKDLSDLNDHLKDNPDSTCSIQ